MENPINIALLQTELVWHNAAKNREQIDQKLAQLRDGVDLVVLPEMFTSGFTMEAEAVAESMDGPTMNWLLAKSKDMGIAICGSLVIEVDGTFRNRFVFADQGEILAVYDKRHLFRMADEHLTFTAGKEQSLFEWKGITVMPRVCYDLRFPVWSRSSVAELQIYVANWPSPRIAAWDKLLMARAIENQCFVVGVNRVGNDEKGLLYTGHSAVVDGKGDVIATGSAGKDEWIFASLDVSELRRFREKFPVHMDADSFEIS